jgi:hypothetical protein
MGIEETIEPQSPSAQLLNQPKVVPRGHNIDDDRQDASARTLHASLPSVKVAVLGIKLKGIPREWKLYGVA